MSVESQTHPRSTTMSPRGLAGPSEGASSASSRPLRLKSHRGLPGLLRGQCPCRGKEMCAGTSLGSRPARETGRIRCAQPGIRWPATGQILSLSFNRRYGETSSAGTGLSTEDKRWKATDPALSRNAQHLRGGRPKHTRDNQTGQREIQAKGRKVKTPPRLLLLKWP